MDSESPVHGEPSVPPRDAVEQPRPMPAPLYPGRIVQASSAVLEIYGGHGAIQEASSHHDALVLESAKRASQISPLAEIFASEIVSRRNFPIFVGGNESWRQSNLDSLRSFEGQRVPACVLSLLRQVTVKDAVIYFDGGETCTMLYEMYRPNDHPTTLGDAEIHLRERSFHPQDQGQAYLYIASAGSHNWGHWLTDDLPRVAAAVFLLDHVPERSLTILLLSFGAAIDEARRRSIECHPRLANVSVEFLSRFVAHQFDELYYASPVSYHPAIKMRSAIDFVRSSYAPTPLSQFRKLFVSRPPGDVRSLVNADEVETFMRQAGFEIVDCATISFDTQLQLFSEASIVVGIMGAAMTNTVFSSAKTAVVQLACDGWLEPFYWDLADVCEQQCCYVFGTQAEADRPAHFARFEVSLNDLAAAIGKMGSF